MPTLKLHHKILLALLLGAIFGALFNVSKYKLEITTRSSSSETRSEIVENWELVEFVDAETKNTRASFGPEDQLKILGYAGKLSAGQKEGVVLNVRVRNGEQRTFTNIISINKVQTVATLIKPVGTLFIRLLMFVAIPMVLSSLLVGAASLGDIRKVGKIGGKTILFYLVTIVSAITLGLALVNAVQPGTRLGDEAREKLMVSFQQNVAEKVKEGASVDLLDTIMRIVPTNPIEALARADMLGIIFFALMVGVSLTLVPQNKSAPVITFFDGLSETMIRMVEMILVIAPFGVFALISAVVGEFGFEILETLGWYVVTLLAGFVLHQFVTLAILVKVLGGMSPRTFFRGIKEVMLIAFSSSSSAATLPVNMEACEKNLGVPKQITSFVLPLGATINMDGTSMYQAVATVFIAQVYGIDLSLGAQLTIILMAVLASIGTAPVPGVGIVMLIIVLRSVHVPEEGIALILGVDRFLDMCRTVLNVSGDAVVAVIMAKQEKVLAAPAPGIA
ncbi:MAG TPA: dicarboxylate/amino acid:cation symporter [Bacteroidota bacterium]|nr:dicarboxylate/amino acid:cation symporter [Bacteroidota bacterium]